MSKPVIFSGIQPTGDLHLGNYLGAVKNWVALQESDEYDCYFSIVDYHSLTGNRSAEERRKQIIHTAAELIACGIDPEKCTFFVQSHVPEHTELAWVFNSVTPMGELRRMTQFKDKSGITVKQQEINSQYKEEIEDIVNKIITEYQNKKVEDPKKLAEFLYPLLKVGPKYIELFVKVENQASVGLATYPVLQAADILLYHGTHVPVGEDQVQHIELTRDTARWFNNKYGEYFPETKALLTEIPRVKSLLEPTKKMSKSLGQGHVIDLADAPDVIEKKMKKAVTATEGGEDAPGVENLLMLLKHFGSEEQHAQYVAAEQDGSIRYGDLKKDLATAISDHFQFFRERRTELLENHDEIGEILIAGAEKASEVARKTMSDVREMIGVR